MYLVFGESRFVREQDSLTKDQKVGWLVGKQDLLVENQIFGEKNLDKKVPKIARKLEKAGLFHGNIWVH